MAATTRAELLGKVAQLEVELEEAKRENLRFKKDVLKKAQEVKQSTDWCDSGYRQALRELGLDDMNPWVEFTIIMRWPMRVKISSDVDEMDVGDIEEAIKHALTYGADSPPDFDDSDEIEEYESTGEGVVEIEDIDVKEPQL